MYRQENINTPGSPRRAEVFSRAQRVNKGVFFPFSLGTGDERCCRNISKSTLELTLLGQLKHVSESLELLSPNRQVMIN